MGGYFTCFVAEFSLECAVILHNYYYISHIMSWPLDFHAASDIFSRIANLEVVLNYRQWFL